MGNGYMDCGYLLIRWTKVIKFPRALEKLISKETKKSVKSMQERPMNDRLAGA
jgi:hypothetical protein